MATLGYRPPGAKSEIRLRVLHTKLFSRRAVYDEANNYLYTRFAIRVSALWSWGATSYGNDLGNLLPQEGPAVNPHETDRAIRHLLMQPRGRLVYTAADYAPGQDDPDGTKNVQPIAVQGFGAKFPFALQPDPLLILVSPAPPGAGEIPADPYESIYLSDATNGPTPIECNVTRVDGFKTFRVEYAIQTDLVERFAAGKDGMGRDIVANPILSHVWAQRQHFDELGFCSQWTRGKLVLNRYVMRNAARVFAGAGAYVADDFRRFLNHPVPPSFKREGVQVAVSEDGNELSYEFVDREQQVSISTSKPFLAKIEVSGAVDTNRPPPIDTVVNMLRQGGGLLPAMMDGKSLIPKTSAQLSVTAWGNRLATQQQLAGVCELVVQTRLANLNGVIPKVEKWLWGRRVRDDFSLTARRYTRHVTVSTGPVGDVFNFLASWTGNNAFPSLLSLDVAGVYDSHRVRRDITYLPGQDLPSYTDTLGGAAADRLYGYAASRMVTQVLHDAGRPWQDVSGIIAGTASNIGDATAARWVQ